MSNVQFCSNCGNKFSLDSAFCSKCGSKTELPELKTESINNQADLAPVIDKSNLPPSDFDSEKTIVYPKADWGKRILAHFIDSIVVIIMLFIVMIIGFSKDPSYFAIKTILIVIAAIAGLYYAFCHDGFNNGQSYGKKFVGLMVVDVDTNQPCSKKKSFKRNVVMCLPFVEIIGVFKALSSNTGKRFGDFWFNTQVIEVKDYREIFKQ